MNKPVGNKPINKNKFKLSKLDILLLAIITPLVLYLLFTVAFPLLIGDGLLFYNGAAKEAGQKAISYSSSQLDNKIRFTYLYHVDEVRPTSAEEINKYCKPAGGQVVNNADDIRYYTVVMSVRRLLTFASKNTITVDGCNAFGPYRDAYKYR